MWQVVYAWVINHPSSQPSIFFHLSSSGSCEGCHGAKVREYPGQGCQSISGITQRDRQRFMLTYTPTANWELNWKPEYLERTHTCNMQVPHRKGQPTSAFKPGTTAPPFCWGLWPSAVVLFSKCSYTKRHVEQYLS